MKALGVLAFCVFILGGCTLPDSVQHDLKNNNNTAITHNGVDALPDSVTKNTQMDKEALFFYLLREEFSHWQGTPYAYGGNSKQGIDCSALVQHIYQDGFNIKLPRTTITQVEKGTFVYQDNLRVGDLVFFKTGWDSRHVGIYIGKNEFIHASTSKGVIISSLNNVYWKPRYWQAKRILE